MMDATNGKMFSGAMFICPEEQQVKSVIVFGPWVEGGKG